MNLVRAGHLHTPVATLRLLAEAGDCSTATVAHVHPAVADSGASDPETGVRVNVGVLDHEGLAIHGYSNVPVSAPHEGDIGDDILEGATFHLSVECPWKR